jgi:glycosyltransferase involved in cell wall biosynthesis
LRKNPLVTIVTPSLNQGQFIRATIESVLSQDNERIEYFVIDGRSTDETIRILASYNKYPNFHFVSESDTGQASAIERGWQLSRGEIFAWLNADDMYLPGAVSQVVEAFETHPECVMVCGNARLINDKGEVFGRIKPPRLDLTGMLRLVDFLPQPAVFMRAEMVEKAGGLDTALDYAFDFDHFLRLAVQGPVYYLERELASYRWHDGAKTASSFYQLRREAAQVARRFLHSRHGNLPADRRHLLSYSHLVEGYANWRLGQMRPFLIHTMKGLALSPANIQWVTWRAFKHIRQNRDSVNAYPYDSALS